MRTLFAVFALALAGCTTTIAPGADPIVVQAEMLAENALDALDAFVTWEWHNEAALQRLNPDIHAAADLVREYGPQYLRDLRTATRAYKAARTGDELDKLKGTMAALEVLLQAARDHFTKDLL